jgi:hypothetical protein
VWRSSKLHKKPQLNPNRRLYRKKTTTQEDRESLKALDIHTDPTNKRTQENIADRRLRDHHSCCCLLGVCLLLLVAFLGVGVTQKMKDERTRVGSENREQGARESRPPSVEPTIRFMVRYPWGRHHHRGLGCYVGLDSYNGPLKHRVVCL